MALTAFLDVFFNQKSYRGQKNDGLARSFKGSSYSRQSTRAELMQPLSRHLSDHFPTLCRWLPKRFNGANDSTNRDHRSKKDCCNCHAKFIRSL